MKATLVAIICLVAARLLAQSVHPDSLDAQINAAAKLVQQGEHERGVQLLLEHLATAEREKLPKSAGMIYNRLALASDRLQDIPGTMRYARLSKQAYEQAGNEPAGVGNAWLFLAIAHARSQQFDSALACARKGLEFFEIAKRPDRIALTNSKIGNIIEMQGKHAEATYFYQNYFDYAQKTGDSTALGFAHTYLAYNLYLQKQYAAAQKHAEQILKFLPAEKTPFDYGVGLQYLSGIREGLGDFRGALEYQRQYSLLRDSTMTKERSQQVAEMEARFQNNQKQAEIRLLEKEKSNQRVVIWASLALLAVLSGAAFLFFKTNRVLRRQKAEIEAKNQQNELLLKEIHHRVKNNLQVVSSLLDLQAQHVSDTGTLDALREGQNRVESMGLIHQRLYQGDNLTGIEMRDYLKNLAQFLLASFGKTSGEVVLCCDFEPIELDVDTAVPIGLIANELITNALKYAFADDRPGAMTIELLEDQSEKTLLLRVSDTGGGVGEASTKGTGFGSQLVKLLSKKLGGTVETEGSGAGRRVSIGFKKYKRAS